MKINALSEMLSQQDVEDCSIRLALGAARDVTIIDNKTG
jgi:hypothetical protein